MITPVSYHLLFIYAILAKLSEDGLLFCAAFGWCLEVVILILEVSWAVDKIQLLRELFTEGAVDIFRVSTLGVVIDEVVAHVRSTSVYDTLRGVVIDGND